MKYLLVLFLALLGVLVYFLAGAPESGQPAPSVTRTEAQTDDSESPARDTLPPSEPIREDPPEPSAQRESAGDRTLVLTVSGGTVQEARARWLPARQVGGVTSLPPEPGPLLLRGEELTIQEGNRIKLPALEEPLALFAQDGVGRWNSLWLSADGPAEATLELVYRFDLWARVQDERGAGVPDREVTLVCGPRGGAKIPARGKTGDGGRVRLRSAALQDGDLWHQRVVVALPGAYWPAVQEVLANPMPAQTTTLTLPSQASIDIQVRNQSGAAVEDATVALVSRAYFDAVFADIEPNTEVGLRATTDRQGLAHFEDFTPESELVAVAFGPHGAPRADQRFVAPGPGGHARIEVVLDTAGLLLVGRMDPPEAGRWYAQLIGEVETGNTEEQSFQLAEDGSFQVFIGAEQLERCGQPDYLIWNHEGTLRGCCDLSAFHGRGTVDVGVQDVRPDVLVEGTVRDEAGHPLPGEELYLFAGVDRDGAPFHRLGLRPVSADDTGHFRLPGRPEGCGLRFQVRPGIAAGTLVRPTTLPLAATNAEVVFAPKPSVSGRLLLPDSWAGDVDARRYLRLFHEDEGTTRRRFVELQPDGQFRAYDLPEPFRLLVRSHWHNRPIEELWPLSASEYRGKSLEVDLRDRLRFVHLTVIDDNEAPISSAYAYLAGQPSGAQRGSGNSQGVLQLLFDEPSLEVIVGAPGYLERNLGAVREEQTVQLQPAPEVTLVWAGFPEIETHQRLRPLLVPAGQAPHADFDTDYAFDAEGRAVMTAPSLGSFDVHLQLETVVEGMRTASLHQAAEPPRIEILGDQAVFQLGWDTDAVKQTLGDL